MFVGKYADDPPQKKKKKNQIYPLIHFVDKAFVYAEALDFNV